MADEIQDPTGTELDGVAPAPDAAVPAEPPAEAAQAVEQAIDPLEQLSGRISALDEQIVQLATEATDKGAFRDVDARLSAIAAEIDELEQRIVPLDGEVKGLQDARDEAERLLTEARQELERLAQVLEEKEAEERRVRERLAASGTEILAKEAEEGAEAEATRTAAAALSEVDATSPDWDGKNAAVAEARRQLAEVREALRKLREEADGLRTSDVPQAESATGSARIARDEQETRVTPLEGNFTEKERAYTEKNEEPGALRENLAQKQALQTRLRNIQELLAVLGRLKEEHQALLDSAQSREILAARLYAVVQKAEAARDKIGVLREAAYAQVNAVVDLLRDALTGHAVGVHITRDELRGPSSLEEVIATTIRYELPKVDPGAENFPERLEALRTVTSGFVGALRGRGRRFSIMEEGAVAEAEFVPSRILTEAQRALGRFSNEEVAAQDGALRTAEEETARLRGEVDELRKQLGEEGAKVTAAASEIERLKEAKAAAEAELADARAELAASCGDEPPPSLEELGSDDVVEVVEGEGTADADLLPPQPPTIPGGRRR